MRSKIMRGVSNTLGEHAYAAFGCLSKLFSRIAPLCEVGFPENRIIYRPSITSVRNLVSLDALDVVVVILLRRSFLLARQRFV